MTSVHTCCEVRAAFSGRPPSVIRFNVLIEDEPSLDWFFLHMKAANGDVASRNPDGGLPCTVTVTIPLTDVDVFLKTMAGRRVDVDEKARIG